MEEEGCSRTQVGSSKEIFPLGDQRRRGAEQAHNGEAGLTANAAVTDNITDQQVQEGIAEKLGESFDTLAMAATETNNTI